MTHSRYNKESTSVFRDLEECKSELSSHEKQVAVLLQCPYPSQIQLLGLVDCFSGLHAVADQDRISTPTEKCLFILGQAEGKNILFTFVREREDFI